MREIHPNLFVGPRAAWEETVSKSDGWWVVHADRRFHKRALGYATEDCDTGHPEYLWTRRDHRLMLNLIDAVVEIELPVALFDTAVEFAREGLDSGARVLIHCGYGVSRSAAIGLLFLRRHTDRIAVASYAEAEPLYERIYPPFHPGPAIRAFLRERWDDFAPVSA